MSAHVFSQEPPPPPITTTTSTTMNSPTLAVAACASSDPFYQPARCSSPATSPTRHLPPTSTVSASAFTRRSSSSCRDASSSPLSQFRRCRQTISHPIHYNFLRAFGERVYDERYPVRVDESDMISAVSFSLDSEMLATGDKGGRIVIFKRHAGSQTHTRASQQRRRWVTRDTRQMHEGYLRSPHSVQLNGEDDGNDDEGKSYDGRDNHDVDDDGRRITFSGYDGPQLKRAGNYTTPGGLRFVPNYRVWTQFQSHDSEFDYLKSMEIEEKINQICWCRPVADTQRLIATNDKTIKIWRVAEREVKAVVRVSPSELKRGASASRTTFDCRSTTNYAFVQSSLSAFEKQWDIKTSFMKNPVSSSMEELQMPRIEVYGRRVRAKPRRVISDAHAYHINSISLNSDEVTFLSADDLRVHLWHMDAGARGFNVLDMKPNNMENLTEVITSAKFHPAHCHILMYASSRGSVRLCDLRTSALCRTFWRKFEHGQIQPIGRSGSGGGGRPSFFSEIMSSISDAKFSPDGRYILTRDYMTLRLWDMNMECMPLRVIPVHDHLRLRLCELYENDCIFDKFQCAFSYDGGSLLTGSYNSLFQSYSANTGVGCAVEASIDYVAGHSMRYNPTLGMQGNMIGRGPVELLDPMKRVLTLDSSRTDHIAAVASGPALYIYRGSGSRY